MKIIWSAIRRIATSTTPNECRARIAAHNATVNAFISVAPLPPPTAEGDETQPLIGRPIAIKDSICTKDLPTTCSSEMLRTFNPPYDATVVRLLRNAGADIIGKTNCDEFGMGSLNTHTIHGPVVNPFIPPSASTSSPQPKPRSAGGSSGGSAAAVAAGMCYAALGTDTGGSTRLPASYCGVVGLKPSYGLLSRWGVVSFADSLDCVGILARNVDITSKVFDVLNVYDPKDPTAAPHATRSLAAEKCRHRIDTLGLSSTSLRGLRVGIPQEYFPAEMKPSILQPFRKTVGALKAMGATVLPVSMPSTAYALSAYYVLASAEASSCLARFDGVQYGLNVPPPPGEKPDGVSGLYAYSRTKGFGDEVKKRVLLGTYALSADAFDNYFLQAQRVRQLVRDDFNRVFSVQDYYYNYHDCEHEQASRPADDSDENGPSTVDVLLHPSAIQPAPELEKPKGETASGVETYVQDVLTVPASLAGVASLSVPMRVEGEEEGDGWPVGVSVVGQWGCEGIVLAVGKAVERL